MFNINERNVKIYSNILTGITLLSLVIWTIILFFTIFKKEVYPILIGNVFFLIFDIMVIYGLNKTCKKVLYLFIQALNYIALMIIIMYYIGTIFFFIVFLSIDGMTARNFLPVIYITLGITLLIFYIYLLIKVIRYLKAKATDEFQSESQQENQKENPSEKEFQRLKTIVDLPENKPENLV